MKNTEKQYRYPGTRPFIEDERYLFFGRNEDIERLHRQIMVEKLIVLFGKSGLGKSSLLNAGVVPLLKEENNFLTISMILGFARAENISPAEFFINKLSKLIDYNNLLWQKIAFEFKETWLNASIDECFWFACKSLQLQNPEQPIIFILDQFEEVFTENTDEINRFAFLLATILHGQTPQNIKNQVIEKLKTDKTAFTKQEINILFEPIDIKFVITTRSDKLSLLNRLKNHIPQILQKTYELQPLNINQAKDALLNPANAEGNFISPIFIYENEVENKIINYLSSNQTKQIETFQLQLICQFCENIVIKNFDKNQNFGKVTINELGELSTIFTRHYDTLINEFTDKNQQLTVRRLIEENMIIDNNRVPLPDKVIISKHNISAELLQKLVNNRLLRSEPNTVGGYSYEISHDTLVEPITTSFKIRFEKEEKERKAKEDQEWINKLLEERKRQRKIIIIVSIAAVVSISLAIFGIVMWQKAEKQTKIVQKITPYVDELFNLKKIETAVENIDTNYFIYDSKFKKYILNVKLNFNIGYTNPNELSDKELISIIDAGQVIKEFICLNDTIDFLLIIEGQSAKIGSEEFSSSLSYNRAKNLVALWKINNIDFYSLANCELLIVGSGERGLPRVQPDTPPNNERFLIQIIARRNIDTL
jgi:flagellar basal body-associated protein FliL